MSFYGTEGGLCQKFTESPILKANSDILDSWLSR